MPAMEHDKYTMADRILRDLATVFVRDQLLEEFDIIPKETNLTNKSPVVHSDHQMGLESWCIKHVYNYAYSVLMERYVSKRSQKLSKVHTDNCDEVDRLLMGALLINPDVTTFWNKRKEMWLKKFLDFHQEMRFTKIVLSRKPKSNEAFAYRKWLLERYWTDTFPPHSSAQLADITRSELTITECCAEKCPNNYHAWTHRIWFLKQLSKHAGLPTLEYVYIDELAFSERWITMHVSDHSGLHYRQFVLERAMQLGNTPYLIDNNDSLKYKNSIAVIFQNATLPNTEANLGCPGKSEKEMIRYILGTVLDDDMDLKRYRILYQNISLAVYELLLNEELSRLYTSHEALWYHRRFVMNALLRIIYDYFSETDLNACGISTHVDNYLKKNSGNVTSHKIVCAEIDDVEDDAIEPKILRHRNHSVYTSVLYKALAINENNFVSQRCASGDSFSLKYNKWLKYVLGFAP